MKTYAYLLTMSMAVSAAMTSCSQDDVVTADPGRPIEFHIDMTSRTTHYTTDNLDQISVFAYDGDDLEFEEIFTRDSNTSTFKSATPHYWEKDLYFIVIGGNSYENGGSNFEKIDNINEVDWTASYGVLAPGQYGLVVNKDLDSPLLVYTLPENATEQYDLVVATASGSASDQDSGIALQFEHILSKITFKAFENHDAANIKLGQTELKNIQTSGIYEIETKKWTKLANPKSQVCNPLSGDMQTLTSEANEYLMDHFLIIPQDATAWDADNDHENTSNGTYLSYKLDVTVGGKQMIPYETSDGQTRDAGYTPIGRNWEAGKQYVYTLDFTDGFGNTSPEDPEPAKPLLSPVQFTCSVVDWNRSAEPTINAGE